MLESEFQRLTDKPFTPEEFEKIHYVYCYYPGVETHADIALIWAIGGIRLIEDMMYTAKRVADAEQELRKARRMYETAKERYHEVLDGNDTEDAEPMEWQQKEAGQEEINRLKKSLYIANRKLHCASKFIDLCDGKDCKDGCTKMEKINRGNNATDEVEPVKRGWWLTWEDRFPGKIPKKKNNLGVFCSECRLHADNKSAFCPQCGARMDGKDEGNG